MSLIDRYLKEVERHLPRAMRGDVTRELRSGIEDAVDSRTGDTTQPREDVVAAVLTEYGDPAKIARSYLPDRYLVGPRYYDAFLTTTKITLAVLAVLIGMGVVARLVADGTTAKEALFVLVEAFGRFPGSAVTFLGIIVVVFAVIERVAEPGLVRDFARQHGMRVEVHVPQLGREPTVPVESDEPWSPQSLPRVEEDRDRINRISLTVDACAYVGLFVLFNFFRDLFRVVGQTNGEWWSIPIDLTGFEPYLWWLNIWFVVSLVTTVMILRDGRWFLRTRLLKIALTVVLIALLFQLVRDPGVVALPPGWPDAFPGVDPGLVEMTDTVFPIMVVLLRVGTAVAAVILVIDTVTRAVRLAMGR